MRKTNTVGLMKRADDHTLHVRNALDVLLSAPHFANVKLALRLQFPSVLLSLE